jgi:hypothetical protein
MEMETQTKIWAGDLNDRHKTVKKNERVSLDRYWNPNGYQWTSLFKKPESKQELLD